MTGLEMKYFVLKPKGDDIYAAASREALRSYARMIKDENSQLAFDLRAWLAREHDASLARKL